MASKMAKKSLKYPNSFIIYPRQVIIVSNPMFLGPRKPLDLSKLQRYNYIIVKSNILCDSIKTLWKGHPFQVNLS